VTVLGIESSCDETAAAVYAGGRLLASVIATQDAHGRHGGVVPELASRTHLRSVVPVVRAALREAGAGFGDLTAVAATQGPGLIGSLLVGLTAGKAIAAARGIPFYPVQHIEAHMFSPFLLDEHPSLPYLCLVVSGGHTLLVVVEDVGRHRILGSTIDDAAGEAFDKVGKMLGLGFPAGPDIDRLARDGDPGAVRFPRPLMDSGDYRFSFSGLKTAVLYHLRAHPLPSDADDMLRARRDICAGFQRAAVDVLTAKTLRAAREHGLHDIAIVGGVSANSELTGTMRRRCSESGFRLFTPPAVYSTDNAAMVALLGYLRATRGDPGTLHAPAFARLRHAPTHTVS
jgi:N6-L-threonylcarbamoyladenine synthase